MWETFGIMKVNNSTRKQKSSELVLNNYAAERNISPFSLVLLNL